MENYTLGICVTSYNRPHQTMNLMFRLYNEYKDYRNIKLYLYVDSCKSEENMRLYHEHKEYLENLGIDVIINESNQGAFRAKYFNLKHAAEECNWLIHCDDDDWVTHNAILEALSKYSHNPEFDIIQFDCARFGHTFKGSTTRFKIQEKRGRNALCLNGLMLRSIAIKPNFEAYENSHLFELTTHRDVWGDDVLLASFLTTGIPDERITCNKALLSIQSYVEGEDHLCFDPEVKKFTSKDKKPFIREVKLKFD